MALHFHESHGGELSILCLLTQYETTNIIFDRELVALEMTLSFSVAPNFSKYVHFRHNFIVYFLRASWESYFLGASWGLLEASWGLLKKC